MDRFVIAGSMVLISSLFINIEYFNRSEKEITKDPWSKNIQIRLEEVEKPAYEELPSMLDKLEDLQDGCKIRIEICEEMELTYLGTYYLTAYCPWECGYNGENYPAGWTTASGEICHRADWDHRLSEPTTCAISRSVHSFGDQFYIPEFDRTFVAEDTGPGVQGYHLDLFYEDYDEMASFPTGYYDVYAVEWVEVEVITRYYET